MDGSVGPGVHETRHEEATAEQRFRTQIVKIIVLVSCRRWLEFWLLSPYQAHASGIEHHIVPVCA
jgi:hypothetical protein